MFDSDYQLLHSTGGFIEIEPQGILELTGEDRIEWLQGQATNDMRDLSPKVYPDSAQKYHHYWTDWGGFVRFCFCSPTGQIVSVASAWSIRERVIIQVPIQTVPAILDRCEKMVIMEDVACQDLSRSHCVFTVIGEAIEALGETPSSKLQGLTADGDLDTRLLLRNPRFGLDAWDVVVPVSEAATTRSRLQKQMPKLSKESSEIAQLEAGIPVFGRDMNEKTLPPEMGPVFESSHISYTKGCYTGQEVLMRIHSRGHTNKTWMGLVSDKPIPEGGVVRTEVDFGEVPKEIGVVTFSTESPVTGHIAGAMIRNEVSVGDRVWVGHNWARVCAFPLVPDEFWRD